MWTIIAIVAGIIDTVIGVLLVMKGAHEAEKGNANAIFIIPLGAFTLGASLLIALMPLS